MKNYLQKTLIAAIMFISVGQIAIFAQIGASGPLITEYIAGADGDGNYSFIEIYNGTGDDLYLEDYSIVSAVNGKFMTDKDGYAWGVSHINGFPITDPKTGLDDKSGDQAVLAPGEIYLFVNENAWKKLDSLVPKLPKTGVYIQMSDWTAHMNNWNGQGPGKAFVYLSESDQSVTPVDVVGVPGSDENLGWGGLQKVFSRKSTIKDPVKTFNSGEWNVVDAKAKTIDLSILSGIGFHPNTVTNNIKKNAIDFVIYPNPASSMVYLRTMEQDHLSIQIFDVRGALVLKQLIGDKQGINVSKLAKGTYVMNVSSKTKSINKKLIIK